MIESILFGIIIIISLVYSFYFKIFVDFTERC